MNQERFEDIIKNGLVIDIFRADEALSILRIFGSQAYLDNNIKLKKYQAALNSIYYSTELSFLMALSKIYDSQSKKYPIRSFNQLIGFLDSGASFLREIREPNLLIEHLIVMKTPLNLIRLAGEKQEEFVKAYSIYIKLKLADEKIISSIELLKNLRDKSLAHNEQRLIPFEGITWKSLIELLSLAKEIVGTVGCAYLSTLYSIKGDYILTDDASRTGRSFSSMLKVLIK